jgi:hypothetical protein
MGTRHWPEDADDYVEELEQKLAKVNERVAKLEQELSIAFECIENSGIDYDEATEHLRKE